MSSTDITGTLDGSSAWKRWRPWLVLLLFSALSLTTVLRHEMWRDEIHVWQALVDAASPGELVTFLRAEAHPGLWNAILYPVSRFTTNPVAMQIVHWMIAVGVAFLVLFRSPFRWSWRVLIVFGYFPLYEYCAISRDYAVGALLLFAFCAVYPNRATRPLAAATLLFLLAQANVYALILSFVLGLMWIVEDRRNLGQTDRHGNGLKVAAAAIWIFGMALSAVQLLGALDLKQPFDPDKALETARTLKVLATPWRGIVPIPDPRFRFWNSNFLDGFSNGAVIQAVLGIALIALIATLFVRRPPVFVLYLAGTVGLLGFTFFVYVGSLRHHGHHMLLLLACLWLWEAGSGGASTDRTARRSTIRNILVVSLLSASAGAGIYATARDWRDPFSAGLEAADTIRAEGLVDLPMVGHRDVQVATVGGLLGRPIYYPALGRETNFIAWNSPNWRTVDDDEVLRQAGVLARQRNSDVLIIFSRLRKARPKKLGSAIRIGNFSRSMVRTERFELYRLPASAAATD